MRSALILIAVLAAAASCGRGQNARPGTEARVSTAPEPAAAPAAQALANRPPSAPAVTVSPDVLGTAYTAADRPYRLTWVVSRDGVNRGVVLHRPDYAGPLSALAPLAGGILDAILADPSRAQALRTLQWGRILPDGPADETAALRLALAASQADGWNLQTGRPRSGDVSGFVLGLARSAGICREIQAVFEARGLRLEPSAVEKVLVSRADGLPLSRALAAAGVPAGAFVPWDAQLWFSIRPLAAR